MVLSESESTTTSWNEQGIAFLKKKSALNVFDLINFVNGQGLDGHWSKKYKPSRSGSEMFELF